MKFGVFDHLDDSGLPLGEFYENRLRLIEAYERVGIHVYLTAEHHATPLGMSPSPSVLHSAIAQRTKRILFGPLVYTLALYHPLRLAEEICMLDHMSGGRFQLGRNERHERRHAARLRKDTGAVGVSTIERPSPAS